MPLPHFTANFVACLEIVGGLLVPSGWWARLIAIPFIVGRVVAILSTRITLLGHPRLSLSPRRHRWVCGLLHEVRSEYAQLLTVVFLLIRGPGKWRWALFLTESKRAEVRS
jgi:putative oxidoreductase